MSQEDVKLVIGRAVMESDFRELLFSDPDKAVEDYELTEDEIVKLKGIDREKFDNVATGLEERISRAGLSFNLFRPERGVRLVRPARPELNPEVSSFFDVFMSDMKF